MTRPIDPRQWAEAFKQLSTDAVRTEGVAPSLNQRPRPASTPFTVGS